LRIDYPHKTWILDDGGRAELRELAESEGIGWITRSADWAGRPRHAKAGNLNNALMATDGEYLLILDADQIPFPQILDRTLGYFRDQDMALVQTPQVFDNVPASDPLGSQAPLFYGPIQQGKDGWNAAFFCGSNAVIRREALMRLGVSRYVKEVEAGVRRALRTAERVLRTARAGLAADQAPTLEPVLDEVAHEIAEARNRLDQGDSLADVTYRFQRRVQDIGRQLVDADFASLRLDLAAIDELAGRSPGRDGERFAALDELDERVLVSLAGRDWSPLGAVESVRGLVQAIDIDRADEAQALMPMATISVTEDMATCMRLHAMGWKSAYHHETLAHGLAPEDMGTMLTQRLRWAQGTMQVMFRENPLFCRGLSIPQRLMYWSTMWSYLSGFAAVVYVAAPMVYLTTGVLPVQSLSREFFIRLIPFLLVNQLLFFIIGRGASTWRGQQYSLALFPIWIKAVTSAFNSVYRGRSLAFAVTPKTKQDRQGPPWHLVRPQLTVMGMLGAAAVIGVIRLALGLANPLGTLSNVGWVLFDLVIFSVIIPATRYRGFQPEEQVHP